MGSPSEGMTARLKKCLADTFPTVRVVSASTASTLVVAVTLVASITTVSTSTNTIPDTSGRLACATSTRPTTSTCPVVNLDRLWTLVSEQTRTEYQKEEVKAKGKVPVIDVTQAGFFKVLGKGRLPDQPVIVKAKYFSKSAEEKIKAVGGACVAIA